MKEGRWVLLCTGISSFLVVFKVKQSVSGESQFGVTFMFLFHDQGWVTGNGREGAGSSHRKKIQMVTTEQGWKNLLHKRYTPAGG